MGEPMKLPQPWLGGPRNATFAEAFPELDGGTIEQYETDLCSADGTYCRPQPIPPLIRCRNPRCEQGGYLIEREVQNMIMSKADFREFPMHCPGHEGSPKGRRKGQSCDHTLHVRLTLRYKENCAMFSVGDEVEIISDSRIGIIKEIHWHSDAANMPGAVGVVDRCLIRFDNDITKFDWFKPEQLRHVK